jgi:hypothetical protein
MTFSRRLLRNRELRAARMRGFETALGLADEPPPVRRVGSSAELRCARCGEASHLESLDLRTSRGVATCPSCKTSWSILYAT